MRTSKKYGKVGPTPNTLFNGAQVLPDWHVPTAENDLREGGKFKTRMEAKDGSMGFDFEGIYTLVSKNKSIAYNMADGRSVKILLIRKEQIRIYQKPSTWKIKTRRKCKERAGKPF